MSTIPQPIAGFTKPQKAAAILVAMGKPSAAKLLKFFKQEELKALIEAARMLRSIPQADLEKIVAEFEAEFAEGAGLLDSGDTMDRIVNETLSPEEVDAIMGKKRVVANNNRDNSIWENIARLDPERIAEFLSREQAPVVAVILSKLAPAIAAKVLLLLDKSLRGAVVKRMISLPPVQPTALRIIETSLQAQLLDSANSKDVSVGQTRVASLLNEMDKDDLDAIMSDLEASGSNDVGAIRARLFSFEDIEQLSQRSRVSLFDGISIEIVTLALRGAPAMLAESVLSSIGARSRRMIEAELATGMEGISVDQINAARKQIATTALRLSSEGDLELPTLQTAA